MSQMNEISMTQKQMMEALESYLNEHVLKAPVSVTGVEKDGSISSNSFTIKLSASPPVDLGDTREND